MMIVRRIRWTIAFIILGAAPAIGQSFNRLSEMENAVLLAAAANSLSPEGMSTALTPVLGVLDIYHVSDRTLVGQS
ncbi:hypothetical protein [Ruegeria sp. HKCCD8929]|uniref:hypothetical protein n=1 Tax=Ruegeria sp. HKCCD8929 TaxID=2683006 RepID=UPI001487AEC9|nr:hypothetical protein [Ruegeria sp. HKCCD8929]